VHVLGLDACRGKWLALVLKDGLYAGAALEADAGTLVAQWPDVAAVGVDIPIGLPDVPWREADRQHASLSARDARVSSQPSLPLFSKRLPMSTPRPSVPNAAGHDRVSRALA